MKVVNTRKKVTIITVTCEQLRNLGRPAKGLTVRKLKSYRNDTYRIWIPSNFKGYVFL